MAKSAKLNWTKKLKSNDFNNFFGLEPHVAATKRVTGKLIDAGEQIYDPRGLDNYAIDYTCVDAYKFKLKNTVIEDHDKNYFDVVVNGYMRKGEYVLDVFIDNLTYNFWVYIGEIKPDTRTGSTNGRIKLNINEAVFQTKSNEDEGYSELRECLTTIIGSAFLITCDLNRYDVKLVEDLSKTIQISKYPLSERANYSNYTLDFSKRNELPELFIPYNGPLTWIKQVSGLKEMDYTQLIEYKYEGSKVNVEPEMFDELPFNNFMLRLTDVDDPENEVVGYIRYYNGDLEYLLYKHETIFNICNFKFNSLKIGTPPTIVLSNSDVHGNAQREILGGVDVEENINLAINAFVEFMYKFVRLMPYAVNASTCYTEHVSTVVQNTSVYKIVVLGKDTKRISTSGHKGGTHASPREHTRIGHKRQYKSGKTVFVKESVVNEGAHGKVHKTYVVNQ